MGLVTREETVNQSRRTLDKWGELWESNCKVNRANFRKHEFDYKKKSEKCYLFSFGPSFESNLKNLIKTKEHYANHVGCVDKALGGLLKYSTIPHTVVTADARIRIDECLNGVDEGFAGVALKTTHFFICATSDPSWILFCNKYGIKYTIFLNKDTIKSHHEFKKYFNVNRLDIEQDAILLPASVNVGNCLYMIHALIYNFSHIFLLGYDYSFQYKSRYYGMESFAPVHRDFGRDKRILEAHTVVPDLTGALVYTSQNLLFSAKWLVDAIDKLFRGRKCFTYNLTGAGIVTIPMKLTFLEAKE